MMSNGFLINLFEKTYTFSKIYIPLMTIQQTYENHIQIKLSDPNPTARILTALDVANMSEETYKLMGYFPVGGPSWEEHLPIFGDL